MGLMDQTAKFIVQLNAAIRSVGTCDERILQTVGSINRRIEAIIAKTAAAEGRAVALLAKLNNAEQPASDVVYVRRDGHLRAVVSLTALKPAVGPVEPLAEVCRCPEAGLRAFSGPKGHVYIDSEARLLEMDGALTQVCVEVLDHDYRSYNGFACFIAVYTTDGVLYIIDAIKFRETLPKMRLLRCGVQKLIHCSSCVERLCADFGAVGCYRNFSIVPRDVYVDWRIRPLNDVLLGIVSEDIAEMVEKANAGLITEKHTAEHRVELSDYIARFGLPASCPMLPELLKLRQYLGRKYDEGIQYVLSDAQLLTLLEASPSSVEEFDQLFPRMSSVVRLHAGDFVLILRRRARLFSLERLKEKKDDGGLAEQAVERRLTNTEEKYRRFGAKIRSDEDSSELCISSCE